MEIKIGGKTRFENLLKTIIPFALVGYEVIITNERYALLGYFITSNPTRAHGIIVIYSLRFRRIIVKYTVMAKPMKTLRLHYPLINK